MPMALKAFWSVTAGLILDEPMAEYTRSWSYTSKDYEADGNRRGALFDECVREANAYAMSLQVGGLNWTKTEYVWV